MKRKEKSRWRQGRRRENSPLEASDAVAGMMGHDWLADHRMPLWLLGSWQCTVSACPQSLLFSVAGYTLDNCQACQSQVIMWSVLARAAHLPPVCPFSDTEQQEHDPHRKRRQSRDWPHGLDEWDLLTQEVPDRDGLEQACPCRLPAFSPEMSEALILLEPWM